jgi:hypothetical protein
VYNDVATAVGLKERVAHLFTVAVGVHVSALPAETLELHRRVQEGQNALSVERGAPEMPPPASQRENREAQRRNRSALQLGTLPASRQRDRPRGVLQLKLHGRKRKTVGLGHRPKAGPQERATPDKQRRTTALENRK